MTKYELFDIFEEMITLLGERTMLGELFDALSTDELRDNLEFIARNYDLSELFED